MTNHEVFFTEDGMMIDEIFHPTKLLKQIYTDQGRNLKEITPNGSISYEGLNNKFLEFPEVSPVKFGITKIPLTSEILSRFFFGIIEKYPNTSPEMFVNTINRNLMTRIILINPLEKLKLQYLLTIFKIVKKFESDNELKNDTEKVIILILDAIAFLSIFYEIEALGIKPGSIYAEKVFPKRFCQKCFRFRERPTRSKFCESCQRIIRMENQRKRRGVKELKKFEFCAGGCGRRLTGKQRVWCGDPKCWLKIYRKKE